MLLDDNQLRARQIQDQKMFEDSFNDLYRVFSSKDIPFTFDRKEERIENAINEILHYYKFAPLKIDIENHNLEDILEMSFAPTGINRRNVLLEPGWYKDSSGPILATFSDGTPVALIPSKFQGYYYYDPKSGKNIKINRKNDLNLNRNAILFYAPLPNDPITPKAYIRLIFKSISISDYFKVIISALCALLINMVIPLLTSYAFNIIIPTLENKLLISFCIFLICVVISNVLFLMIRNTIINKLTQKISLQMQSSFMGKIVSLPSSFFKEYGSGEIALDVQYIPVLCQNLIEAMFYGILPAVLSVIYLIEIAIFVPSLVWVAILVILLVVAVAGVATYFSAKREKIKLENDGKLSNLVYSSYMGIQKIKLTGSEKRVFSKWGKIYAKSANIAYNPPLFLKISSILPTLIVTGSMIIIYLVVGTSSSISTASFVSFNSTYGLLTSSLLTVAAAFNSITYVPSILSTIKPVLENKTEYAAYKKPIGHLSGRVEVSNLSFSYGEGFPDVISHLNLSIKPKEYLGIVGATGCGKSTLIRLLLGLETPTNGSIFYDGKDLADIDIKSLRRHLGVVMQGSKLFNDSIAKNILVSAPWLNYTDAEEAASKVGLDKDLADMPMGLNTYVSEGSGGLSGGQKQKILIARSIINRPGILVFDEATSALDNISQKLITEMLDTIKCTRIVVAHRLSTIKACSRIVVLEKGNIVEEGTYEQLIALNGKFAELIKKQLVDGSD